MSEENANKRVAKNTIYLYIRMVLVMGIGLYTVRAILGLLGETDYGIYNVVGGVVSLFSFISGSLSTASQRYFSMSLAKGDFERLNKWFSLNINLFVIIIIGCFVLAETLGLWFVNTQLTIPEDRMFAANVIYQFVVVGFGMSLFNVPHLALVIAHEKMSAFAYIGIFEALAKLVIVGVLSIVHVDRLIIYGVLLLGVSIAVTLCYVIYCHRHFPESRYRYYWNKLELRELFSFSGWHLLGTISVVVRGQGVNILLNMFFNPAVNAARAIAYQIEHATIQLENNFFMAVKPQIYKLYALREFDGLHRLIVRSTQLSFLLTSILTIPLLFETPYVLSLWLKDIPQYTLEFTRLVLVLGLLEATNGPMIASVLATGKIRNFYLVIGSLYILVLPLCYIALRLGCEPQMTVFITILVSIVSVLARVVFLKYLIRLPMVQYLGVLVRLLLVTMLISVPLFFIVNGMQEGFVRLFVVCLVSSLLHLLCYYVGVISKHDKEAVRAIVLHKIRK